MRQHILPGKARVDFVDKPRRSGVIGRFGCDDGIPAGRDLGGSVGQCGKPAVLHDGIPGVLVARLHRQIKVGEEIRTLVSRDAGQRRNGRGNGARRLDADHGSRADHRLDGIVERRASARLAK